MKRTPMPRRRTPLVAKMPLRQKTPLMRSALLPSRSVMAFKPKPRKRKPAAPDTGFPESVKRFVRARSGGICELDSCGPADHFHHRAPRGSGGSDLAWINGAANCLFVSWRCHYRIEMHRATSYENGWLVRRNGIETAAAVEVLYRGRRAFLVDEEKAA